MTPDPYLRWTRRLQWACALYPLLFLGCALKLALAAHHRLGRWPVPSLDDPKSLGIDGLYLQNFALLILMPGALLGSLLLLAGSWGEGRLPFVARVLVTAATWTFWFVLVGTGLGQWYFDWFLD